MMAETDATKLLAMAIERATKDREKAEAKRKEEAAAKMKKEAEEVEERIAKMQSICKAGAEVAARREKQKKEEVADLDSDDDVELYGKADATQMPTKINRKEKKRSAVRGANIVGISNFVLTKRCVFQPTYHRIVDGKLKCDSHSSYSYTSIEIDKAKQIVNNGMHITACRKCYPELYR